MLEISAHFDSLIFDKDFVTLIRSCCWQDSLLLTVLKTRKADGHVFKQIYVAQEMNHRIFTGRLQSDRIGQGHNCTF